MARLTLINLWIFVRICSAHSENSEGDKTFRWVSFAMVNRFWQLHRSSKLHCIFSLLKFFADIFSSFSPIYFCISFNNYTQFFSFRNTCSVFSINHFSTCYSKFASLQAFQGENSFHFDVNNLSMEWACKDHYLEIEEKRTQRSFVRFFSCSLSLSLPRMCIQFKYFRLSLTNEECCVSSSFVHASNDSHRK